MKFNLNGYVAIKLNSLGRNELLKIGYHFEEDEDGWSTWRGWELFKVFSHLFNVEDIEWSSKASMGFAKTITLPFEPVIDIKCEQKINCKKEDNYEL